MVVRRETRPCANVHCTRGPGGSRAILHRRPREFARAEQPTCSTACTNALPVHRRTVAPDPTGIMDAVALFDRLVYRRGYPYVRLGPDYPGATSQGYVLLSHLIMARHLGRPLAENEQVIYVDGNPQNCAVENLVVRKIRRAGEG